MALWDLSRSRSHNLNKFDRGSAVKEKTQTPSPEDRLTVVRRARSTAVSHSVWPTGRKRRLVCPCDRSVGRAAVAPRGLPRNVRRPVRGRAETVRFSHDGGCRREFAPGYAAACATERKRMLPRPSLASANEGGRPDLPPSAPRKRGQTPKSRIASRCGQQGGCRPATASS